MKYDPLLYTYPSHRNVVYASRGMVCTAQPQAAQAGLEILKKGGNAVDAAVATAAALTVTEPNSNNIGSDNFAIIWYKGKLYGINGSGRAPMAFSLKHFAEELGLKSMPQLGWGSSTVPGAPKTWAVLNEKMGRLSLAETLEPAAQLAEHGYPVAPTIAINWDRSFKRFSKELDPALFEEWCKVFAPKGRAPRAGELWKSEDTARTLRSIGATNAKSFYEGELAEKMVAYAQATGGYFTMEDLKMVDPEWVEPLHVNYRGYDVWELPPNGQGIIALIALNILKGYHFDRRCPETFHRQIEAIKLAFADAGRYVADPRFARVPVEGLLSDAYADVRRALIGDRALFPEPGLPDRAGTVYLCTADEEGNMVSFIQSNYKNFGSGIVVPGTGIGLNCRAMGFSLDPEHPNVVEGGKRPYITIIPGFLTKDGQPVGPFGVMGGYMQPQGHVQVVMNMVDFGMNPQQALDAPRWQYMMGMDVEVEPGFSASDAQALARMGHNVRHALDSVNFGRGEMILRTEEGTLIGATEPRADGTVAAW